MISQLFFFNDTATTEIYTLSLHDALPISEAVHENGLRPLGVLDADALTLRGRLDDDLINQLGSAGDRKSTRLNSSHANISYAVFCLKKKRTTQPTSPALSVSTTLFSCLC